MRSTIYLDHAATTPIDSRVLKAMAPYWSADFYNPSSLYEPARRVKAQLEAARSDIARVLGAKQSEIIFTAGATESINLALFGIARQFPKAKFVVSAIEHEAVLASAQAALTARQLAICPVKPSGLIDLEKLAELIDEQTVLVAVMYANNEIGTVQPLGKIAALIEQQRRKRQLAGNKLPLYFYTDAAQAANYLDLHVSRLGVDMMSLNGSKLYGPKQSGCLYIRSGTKISPLIFGGGQEKGLRSGTENVAGSIGFAAALKLAANMRTAESQRLSQLRDYVITEISTTVADVSFNGDMKQRLPNNINLTVKGVSGESLVHYLDAAGILVATGSACSANNDQPSHVLKAIGLKPAAVNSSLRITMGRGNTKAQLDRFITELARIVKKLR